MWARLEYALRAAAAGALAALGTRGVSLALMSLSAAAGGTSYALGAFGGPEHGARFATSPVPWAIVLGLLVDGCVAAARVRQGIRSGARGERAAFVPQALLRAAQIAWALALAGSLAGRSGFEVRLAEGETFSAQAEQLVSVDPSRWVPAAPFGGRFTIDATASRELAPDRAEVVLRMEDRSTRPASRRRPAWLGWGRFVRPVDEGWALEFELATAGAPLESAVVKLVLEPAGSVDTFRLATQPYRVFVALAREQPPLGPRGPALEVAVYRGKRAVAQGAVAPGVPLVVEGGRLRFPAARRWVTLRMTSDPGLPVAVLAVALAVSAACVSSIRRRSARAG